VIHWLASYPRSGNTWCRAFLTNLLRGAADINSLVAEPTATNRDAIDSYGDFASSEMTADEIDLQRRGFYQRMAREARAPLPMKLHCAYRLAADGLPLFPAEATAGVVLIVRNPFDVAVSLAHFLGFSMDESIAWMASDDAEFCPQRVNSGPALPQRVMSWSSHAESWLKQNSLPVHLVRYEDLLADPEGQFRKLADFMGLGEDGAAVREAVQRSRFEELRKQEAAQGCSLRPASSDRFFRNGKAGGWREVLTGAQVERIARTHEATMERLGYAA
jgi:hypothetical protein